VNAGTKFGADAGQVQVYELPKGCDEWVWGEGFAGASAYHSEYEDFILNDSAKVEVVQEGAAFDVLGEVVRVFKTPGHDPSCLCFEVDGRLFTGDAFIPGVKVFTGFPKSDKKLAAASEQRILTLSEGLTVCLGHEV